ncbi:hypothetical protein [Faecalibaculum rodentium]|uniref:hypothetical protein n=1 Tax=Faecalibaculum rodentium TaxID=1702221 RepID=UPI00082BE2CB|nr:hypothetical protein [Faecalibaculum rodentium]
MNFEELVINKVIRDDISRSMNTKLPDSFRVSAHKRSTYYNVSPLEMPAQTGKVNVTKLKKPSFMR